MLMARPKMKGPELLLRCLRARPDSSPIFRAAEAGNVSKVRDLLVNGDASLFDVRSDGESILHVCRVYILLINTIIDIASGVLNALDLEGEYS